MSRRRCCCVQETIACVYCIDKVMPASISVVISGITGGYNCNQNGTYILDVPITSPQCGLSVQVDAQTSVRFGYSLTDLVYGGVSTSWWVILQFTVLTQPCTVYWKMPVVGPADCLNWNDAVFSFRGAIGTQCELCGFASSQALVTSL